MNIVKTRIAAAAAAVLAAGCFTSTAYAGCSPFDSVALPGAQPPAPSQPETPAPGVNGFRGVQFVQAAATGASFEHAHWRWDDPAPIVGLWHIQLIVNPGTPNETVIDDGYATWHEDGTELMNSGRAPKTGSFCMGVWKRQGPSTFKLNHIALSWDDTGTDFIGPTSIRETVTVDKSGNKYSGTFKLTQYLKDGKTAVGGAEGKVVGTRINP